MNYISLSRVLMLTSVLFACSSHEEQMIRVSPEEYASEKCWVDEKGNFSSFLVLAREDDIGTPYVVSARCFVDDGYSSYGEGVLHQLNAIRLVDHSGHLQKAFPGVRLLDGSGSHEPVPSSASKLYLFTAKASRTDTSLKPAYDIKKVEELRYTKMSFEQFLSLPQKEREDMLARLRLRTY